MNKLHKLMLGLIAFVLLTMLSIGCSDRATNPLDSPEAIPFTIDLSCSNTYGFSPFFTEFHIEAVGEDTSTIYSLTYSDHSYPDSGNFVGKIFRTPGIIEVIGQGFRASDSAYAYDTVYVNVQQHLETTWTDTVKAYVSERYGEKYDTTATNSPEGNWHTYAKVAFDDINRNVSFQIRLMNEPVQVKEFHISNPSSNDTLWLDLGEMRWEDSLPVELVHLGSQSGVFGDSKTQPSNKSLCYQYIYLIEFFGTTDEYELPSGAPIYKPEDGSEVIQFQL